jgi:formamidopyrimidine-DNA glycosylase
VPELPDVEGFRVLVRQCARGSTVERVHVPDRSVLHEAEPSGLGRALHGCRFVEPERRGKWLLAHTTGPTLLFHFGMTGELHWCDPAADEHPHDRVNVFTDGGELRYRDQRKLKGLWLAREQETLERVIGEQGPDAMEIDRATFVALLRRRGTLKTVLSDQRHLAGLGNLLCDEILWQAKLAPQRHAAELDERQARHLHTVMRRVLRTAIRSGRVPPKRSWLTGARDRQEGDCPRCGTPLCHGRLGGRATVWCPHCQP